MSDSESDDSDYTPEPEKKVKEAPQQAAAAPSEGVLTGKRKQRVDDLWASLNETETASQQLRAAKTGKAAKPKKKAGSRKANKVLASIFGKSTAKSIMGKVQASGDRSAAAAAASTAAAKALKAPEKKQVTEVKKFAGREITVTRTVVEGSREDAADAAAAAAAKKPKTNLDNVLSGLEEAKNISTVTKSSLDWDSYKEVEGLNEELSTVTKDGAGYLHRQDFLTRVDQRRFEQERDQRMARRK